MKHQRYPRMMILAATMITALFLFTPVCWAYVPPGGGGGSGGSSSGTASYAGSGENTYSSTVSSGTWTPLGDGLNQAVFRNNLPVSTITIKSTAPGSGTPPAQLPSYTVSVMSDINTNKLIQSVQETPGQGPVIVSMQRDLSTPLLYEDMAETANKDPEYHKTAASLQKSSKDKTVPVTGGGIRYDITPEIFGKIEYNFTTQTTITKSELDSTVKIQTHQIKAGAGFRL